MNNTNHHGGSLHAFMWGAILGAGAVFLLGTKRGKKILKTISEEGVELSELFEEVQDDDDEEEIKPKKCGHCKPKEEKIEGPQMQNVEEKENVEKEVPVNKNGTIAKVAGSGRRFFKRPQKKS